MENEFEIELQQPEEAAAESLQLPVNFLRFGELESDDIKVYIHQKVYRALEKLAASDTSKELGSILLGEYVQDLGKTHVVISDCVEAKYTDASAATLTFTHETWDYVHAEHERRCPDKKIIGWQHTHPNYGIFLSNYDMFIQENFFNLPFQVAYVIDPVQKTRGFFQWKNGKIEKLAGYYVYDEPGKSIKMPAAEKPAAEKSAPARGWTPVLGLLIAAILALAVSTVSLGGKYARQLEQQQELAERMSAQEQTILGQEALIQALQSQVDAAAAQPLQAEDVLALLEEREDLIPALQELLGLTAASPSGEPVGFVVHSILPGETLAAICQQHGIDMQANLDILLAINGISDANRIYAGQNLLLPVLG